MRAQFLLKSSMRVLLFCLVCILNQTKVNAQNQEYWRESFTIGSGLCNLTTISPTTATSGYFKGANSGSWWGKNVYNTTGTGCPPGNAHVRARNISGVTDSAELITPVVDFGIQEFHFMRARNNRRYSVWVTSDTSALTTNWTIIASFGPSLNATCVDTTIIVASPSAKRLKLVLPPGMDTDVDSLWLTSFYPIRTAFVPGNLVLNRVGGGVTTLSSAGARMTLIEITPSGTLVDSIPIPFTGSERLVCQGSSSNDASITHSTNGQNIVVYGYVADEGSTSPASAVNTSRTVRLYNTNKGYTDVANGVLTGNARCATYNGTNVWVVGAAGGVIARLGLNGTGLKDTVSTTITNNRFVYVQYGQLYSTAASGATRAIHRIGNGTPNTGPVTAIPYVSLPSSSNPNTFCFNPDTTICFVGFDGGTVSTIHKYARTGTTWTKVDSVNTGSSVCRSLTVDFSKTNPIIYAILQSNTLVKVTDIGSNLYSQSLTTLYNAPTNMALRGISFTPGTNVNGSSPTPPSNATITTSGTLTAFSTCAGTASTQQSFSVSGANLTANIIITPPSGYEVSTTSGTGFTSSVSLTPSSGTVASTTIYVRLTSSATGTPSGNIVASSTGATSQNVAANGTVNALPTITLGSVSSVLTTATSFNLPYTATTGSPNQYSITTGTPTAMSGFTAVTDATLGSSPIAVTIPASAANTYNFNITVKNSTTGCASANTAFTLGVTTSGGPAGPPVISSITPTSAKPGDTIVLSGSDFNSTAASNHVFIGGIAATITQASSSQLRVIVPSGANVDYILVINIGTGLSGQSLGKFTPTFSPPISNLSSCYFGSTVVKSSPSTGTRSVAVGDLTGDGKPDLVVAASNPARISIYRNISSTGTLDSNSFDTPFSLSVLSIPNEIVIKDFDRDGKQDIAVVNYLGAQLALFKNQYSTGTFDSTGFAPRILIPATTGYFRMAAGDIDNDGKIDLVAARVNGFVGVFKNNSSVGVLDNTSFSAATSFPILPNVSGIDLADFNNDGKIDIVLSSYDSAIVDILQNTSTSGVINSSSFAPRIIIPTNKKNSQGVVAADFDNDGKVDFATAGYTDNYLRVFQNIHSSGNLGINSFATVDSFLSQSSSSIATGDVTGDGKLDVIMGSDGSSSNYKILVNKSTPGIIDTASFAPAITLTGPNNTILSLKVADLNGDNKPEIIGAFNATSQVGFRSLITPAGLINVSGTLNAFNSCTGFVSDTQSVMVTGSGLTANIIATPPAGFEISTSPTSGFTPSSLTLTQSFGNVNSRVYIRLRNSASGTPSGNLSFTSTCANTQNINLIGTVNAIPTITLGTVSSVSNTATSFNLPYSATTGSPNQYSIAAGAPGGMPSFTPVVDATLGSSPIAVTIPASAANTYNFLLVVKNSTTGCQSSPVPFSVTVNAPASPTINVSGSLTAFSACAGTASEQQSFTVSGSNLSADITITPPTGYEVTTTSGTGFASSVALTPSSGTVASTTIYVRLASSSTGTPSGNIVASSTGATSQNVAASGTVNELPTITLGSVSPVLTSATSFNLPYSATTGSPNQYSITTGTPTAMSGFTAVTDATLGSSPIAVTIPASAANTYNFNLTVKNTSTGCPSNSIPFVLNVINPVPTVTISGSFDPIAACSGIASSAQQFKVGGLFLTGNITVTAPAGFEIATTLSGGYGPTINLNPVSGVITDTPLYIRMSSSATGTPSGNITCSSAGATDKTIAISGTIIPNPAKPVISIQAANPICQGAEYLNFGAATEAPAGVSYQWSATNALLYAQGNTKQHALVSFPNAGDVTVTLTATQNGCNSEENITYSVKAEQAHTATIRYFNKNFVCEVNEVSKYQWGFDDLPTLKGNVLNGEITQNYYNANPDLATKSYWAITTKGNCYQKTYYNKPASVGATISNDKDLRVYPNPFTSEITLSANTKLNGASISLIDMNGKVLYRIIATSQEPKLNLSELSSGIYFIQLSTENGQVSNTKIIKY